MIDPLYEDAFDWTGGCEQVWEYLNDNNQQIPEPYNQEDWYVAWAADPNPNNSMEESAVYKLNLNIRQKMSNVALAAGYQSEDIITEGPLESSFSLDEPGDPGDWISIDDFITAENAYYSPWGGTTIYYVVFQMFLVDANQ